MTPAAELEPGREAPEHRNDRRRFLVWAVLLGAAPPERLTERIVAEIQRADVAEGVPHE